MKSNLNISFIGAGNVAEALAVALYRKNQRIKTVTSLSGVSADALASKIGAVASNGYQFSDDTDIIIIAVNDESVGEVARALKCSDETIIVHTAGSVAMSVLGRSDNAGVLYPLQTFTRGREVNMKAVPFFIEATDEQTMEVLNQLALLVGSSAHQCVSERRRYLHLAAVFACNFPDFMLTIASELVRHAEFNPGVLHPLIKETVGKAVALGPENAQTGPARRGDMNTIRSQLELLSFNPEYHDLYEQVSNMIMNRYNTEKNDKF